MAEDWGTVKKTTCVVCGRTWQPRYGPEDKTLECPKCGYLNEVPWEAQQGWEPDGDR